MYPLTDFILYNDSVLIESITAQQRLDAADEVALYERSFDQLRAAAATGEDAVAPRGRTRRDTRRMATVTAVERAGPAIRAALAECAPASTPLSATRRG